jgi:hypothetical protein
MADFMMPNLSEDDALDPVAEALATLPDDSTPAPLPAGVNVLVGPGEDQEEPAVDIKRLVNLVTQPDKRIDIPGTKMLVDRDNLREAIGDAVKGRHQRQEACAYSAARLSYRTVGFLSSRGDLRQASGSSL